MGSSWCFFSRCLQVLKESSRCYRDTRLGNTGAATGWLSSFLGVYYTKDVSPLIALRILRLLLHNSKSWNLHLNLISRPSAHIRHLSLLSSKLRENYLRKKLSHLDFHILDKQRLQSTNISVYHHNTPTIKPYPQQISPDPFRGPLLLHSLPGSTRHPLRESVNHVPPLSLYKLRPWFSPWT